MKSGRRKGGAAIPAALDTGRRKRSNMAQPVFKSTTGRVKGGAAQNIVEITSDDLVQNGGQYKLMGGAPIPMEIVTGRRRKQGATQVVYPVDLLGNYDPSFAGYIYKVLTSTDIYDASSLIGFWPQNELAGGVSVDYSGEGNDGAYAGVTLGQPGVPGMGMTSPFYDGANDYNNIYSAGLVADFDGAEGTVITWTKIAAIADWNTITQRMFFNLRADASNYVSIYKSTTAKQIVWYRIGGGTPEAVTKGAYEPGGWVAYGITWSETGDKVIAYLDGVQEGATQTVLGAWAGNLAAIHAVIGAGSTIPTVQWIGNSGPTLLYSEAKSPAEVAHLSTP